MSGDPKEDAVTRFEVIDHRTGDPAEGLPLRGRIVVAWPASVKLSYQDGGRTLKVFLTDPKVTR